MRDVRFPYTHDIAALLKVARDSGLAIPAEVHRSQILSAYAIAGRYPAVVETVAAEEYEEAVQLAETVVAWAEQLVSEARETC